MNTLKDNPIVLDENERPPYSLNALELGLVVIVGVATWFGFSRFLHSSLPFPCGSSVNGMLIDCGWTEKQAWESLGYPLFSTYSIPLVMFLTVSSVFLLRSIRKDVYHFSTTGNLAFSFSIFSFIGFLLLNVFGLVLLPVGLVLAIIATINSKRTRSYRWDWVSLPFNLIWLVTFGSFVAQFLNSYGD